MLDSINLNNKSFEQIRDEAVAQIPLYSKDWTNYNISDPGITILENFAAFLALQQGELNEMPEHVREKLKKEGYSCSLANGRFVKPVDTELVAHLAGNHGLIVTLEENVLQGGYGLAVTAYIHAHFPHIKVLNVALPDAYVEHGNVSILREGLGIDSDSIIRSMKAGGWLE